ncbi:TetR/AcrR family transcriptional regulator [Lacticaseibacillus jixianensis]|uniref:TetR/AcrR family transcriptional regulator n=1 Tax=Lacticaseibacillus jixianensis TaxID=2486012 RepID=A0ABW4B850_9LACO|nr:TetR/AcrR family transcriptional regulator [Lacticaseibacillus jixianensis]
MNNNPLTKNTHAAAKRRSRPANAQNRIPTKQRIFNELKQMILEMDYHKITVKALTARLGINRKTFYLYYPTLPDLFLALEDQIFNQMLAGTKQHLKEDATLADYFLTQEFMTIIESDPQLQKKLICDPSYAWLYENVRRRYVVAIKDDIKRLNGGQDMCAEITANFIINSIFYTYRAWLSSETNITQEALATIISDLIHKGVDSTIKPGATTVF